MIAPWIDVARQLVGQREIKGPSDNPLIVEMFRLVDNNPDIHDEEPWCAAFVGSCLELAGYRSTRSLAARSYENWGKEAPGPIPGCIAVLWRLSVDSGKGHVGFYVREDGDQIVLLGGNQGDSVREQAFPKARVLGYRWPQDMLAGPAFSPLIHNISEISAGGGPAEPLPLPAEAVAAESGPVERGMLTDVEDPVAIPAAVDTTTATRALARPMTGEDVRDLQEKLRILGYPVGTIDGEFGQMTEAAVFEFQLANGLPQNGIADSRTLAALVGGQGPKLAPARVQISETELLEKGSRIVMDARAGKWAAVATGVLGLFGFSDANLDIFNRVAEILKGGTVDPASGAITQPPAAGSGNTFLTGIIDHLPQLLGAQGGVWAGLLVAGGMAWRYFNKAAAARVSDHASGVNRGQ